MSARWMSRENIRIGILLLLLLITTFIWYAVYEANQATLQVSFLNIGQGDAVFIEAPNGNQMLVDGGPGSIVLRELGRVMPFYDRTINVVVATHPDKDHIGGLPDVLNRYKVAMLFRSGAVNDTNTYEALNKAAQGSQAQELLARRGLIINLGAGVFAKVLFPDHDVSRVESNDASIILQVVYGNTEFMLTGDAPQKIERYLASLDGNELQSDVLKLGHHGSKTSSSEVFLGAVDPYYAVISAGKDNQYGHPHKEVLDRLSQFNIPSVSTAKRETITFRSDGENVFLAR